MPSTDPYRVLPDEDREALLRVARESIAHGLEYGHALTVDPYQFSAELQETRATFVTLKHNGTLRGCVGALEPSRPLVQDVAQNAYAAAFRDPRFHPLTAAEQAAVRVHISILSSPEAVAAASERELLAQLRPGVDGVILQDEGHRGTFLPSVWEQLPDAREFLRELKRKAGLPPDYWSESLRILRYTAESFPED